MRFGNFIAFLKTRTGLSLIVFVVLIGGLAASVVVVQQVQETRSRAMTANEGGVKYTCGPAGGICGKSCGSGRVVNSKLTCAGASSGVRCCVRKPVSAEVQRRAAQLVAKRKAEQEAAKRKAAQLLAEKRAKEKAAQLKAAKLLAEKRAKEEAAKRKAAQLLAGLEVEDEPVTQTGEEKTGTTTSSGGSSTTGSGTSSQTKLTNTPTPTKKPTATSTPKPSSVPTVKPTNTPVPVPPGNTTFAFDLLLHGLGNAGDNANKQGGGNKNLVHLQRQIKVEVYDVQNQLAKEAEGVVVYNSSSGSFKGTVDMGKDLTSGAYTVKVKLPQSLKTLIPGIQIITAGAVKNFSQTTLVNGDMNDDNVINILDFDILLACYSDFAPAENCTSEKKIKSDITDDGSVNQFDYNLFLRELGNLGGQ